MMLYYIARVTSLWFTYIVTRIVIVYNMIL